MTDGVRAGINEDIGVECMCCESLSGVVARFNTQHGGVYLCKDCLLAGLTVIDDAEVVQ